VSYSHLERANDVEPSDGHRYLREQCPLHVEESHDPPFYVVSKHVDVFDLLTRHSEWRNGFGVGVNTGPDGVLGTTDEPDHRRQRRLLQDSFRPAAIARLAAEVEQVGDELWQRAFAENGEGDFVRLFAFPFPAAVIAALLGVPIDRRDEFGRWSDDIVNSLGGADPALADEANRQIFALVDDLVDSRKALHAAGGELPPDVLSVMTLGELDGTVSHREVRKLSQQLLVAGHETTASLISLMLYRLIERPELVTQLRADPDLIASAVEEFMRYDSPVQGLFRVNPEPSEVCGQELPAGSRVQALFASANRDPDVWDDPDEIRLDRHLPGSKPHLAFGWGIHHCIGAPLARREGQLALRWIVERFETVERVGDIEINEPFILRGLTTLPIRWTVRRSSGHASVRSEARRG
jgi:cytochrome P450